MATFDHVLVSAEAQKSTFGFLSVSAENDVDFRPSGEYLFYNVKLVNCRSFVGRQSLHVS